MSKNIFENAKFGDAYKTRDGRKAIYLGESHHYELVVSDGDDYYTYHEYNHDGTSGCKIASTPHEDDIISKWNEPIDSEKLCQLADEMNPYNKIKYPTDEEIGSIWGYNTGFINGYRKAEEKLL